MAFHGFLNRFIVCPDIQLPLCEPWQRLARLLCQSRCKIPRPHHIDIIFLALYSSHPSKKFRLECFIQVMPHQHPYGVAHSIEPVGIQPAADGDYQRFLVLGKNFRAEAVAGGPVVDVGQKPFRFRQGGVIIPDSFDEKRVQVVLLVVFVGEAIQKGFRLGCTIELLCQLPQKRCAHTDDCFWGNCGHQLALKILIGIVLQGKQLF